MERVVHRPYLGPDGGEDSAEPAQLPRPRPGSVGALRQDIALRYNVIHSALVYLIRNLSAGLPPRLEPVRKWLSAHLARVL